MLAARVLVRACLRRHLEFFGKLLVSCATNGGMCVLASWCGLVYCIGCLNDDSRIEGGSDSQSHTAGAIVVVFAFLIRYKSTTMWL